MAGRRALNPPEDADFIEGGEAIDTEFEDKTRLVNDQKEEEQEISAEFGDAGDAPMHFQVRKQLPNSRNFAYCFDGTRQDLPVIPRIQREFGAGSYAVWIFKNGKLYRKIPMHVIEPRPGTTAPGVPVADPNFTRLIDLLEKQAAGKPAKSLLDGVSLPEALMAGAAVITALKGVFNNPQPMVSQANGMKDTLELLSLAKEMFGGAGDDREKSFLDIADTLLKSPLLANIQLPAPGAASNAPQLPAPGNKAPTPEEIQQAQFAQIRNQLDYMITRARKNSNPDLYADFIEDNFPPEMLAMLKAPGALEFLLQIHPPIGTYRSWFEALLHSLNSTPTDYEPDDTLPENEAPPTADVPQRSASALSTNFDPGRFGGGSHDFESDGGEGEGG